MIRIVAGRLKGRKLQVPISGSRPTSERVREAIFNALRGYLDLDGAKVLDLYAGSGALAVEALSRGAQSAICVDSGHNALTALRANVKELDLGGELVVRSGGVLPVLAQPAPQPFDLVFADPPYAIAEQEIENLLQTLVAGGWAAADSVLVLERSAHVPATAWPEAWEPLKTYQYGDTRVEFAQVTA